MRKKIIPFAFVLSLFVGVGFGLSIGHASWHSPSIQPKSTDTVVEAENSSNPVAFFGSHYYGSVEGAVTAANKLGSQTTVYVIPGTNPIIKKSFTINTNVTLCLPYSTNYSSWWKAGLNGKQVNAFTKASTYRKSLVTVGDDTHQGIVIVNHGTIQIGGIINGGGGGQDLASNTGGDYAEMTFYGNSSLQSYGYIHNYGYITGTNCTGSISFKPYSSTQLVYTVREHRGGTCMSYMYYNLKSFPMSRWYFAGVRDIDMTFEYNSNLVGFIDMYASSSHYNTTINFLGGVDSGALVALSPDTKMTCRFTTSTMVTRFDFYGSFTFNTLRMYMIVSLSTESVEFPISWYQNIYFHKFENGNEAIVNSLVQMVKLMPNAILSIDSGVTVNARQIAVYDETFSDTGLHCVAYQNDFSSSNPMVGASLIVNGTLNVTNFGGIALTSKAGSALNYTNGSVNSYEVATQSSGSVAYNTWNWKAKGKLSDSAAPTNLSSSNGKYVSKGTYWQIS